MNPQNVTINLGHHVGQSGVWMHNSGAGVPMIRLNDTACVMTHDFTVTGEHTPPPIQWDNTPKKRQNTKRERCYSTNNLYK
jgi:hypothetical protein